MGSNDSKPAVGRSEYGRVKVALPPGKGLMDWVRLASGKVLAKKRMSVDHEELMKHNKQNDCWIHIFGQVYDVTSYLEFHPGGIPELMRAAGTDGTDLFNQIHAWVNYENMLKSCLVGRFTGDLSKLPKPGPSTADSTNQQPSVSAQLNALIMKGKQNQETYGVTFTMDVDTVMLSCPHWYSANLRLENVVVEWSTSKKHFRIVVRPMGNPAIEVKWDGISTESALDEYRVLVKDGQITVTFDGRDVNIADALSNANRSMRQSPLLAYHECTIEEKRSVSHDTRLFSLRLPEGIFFPITVGRHISFRIKKGSSKLYRQYTPVNFGSMPEDVEEDFYSVHVSFIQPARVIFLIKIYPHGICTPSLDKLEVGDTIEISEPVGNADLSLWIDPANKLLMLAAGTGLTPMVNVLSIRLRRMIDQGLSSSNTQLLLFNKTEKDIVDDDWLPMKWNDTRVKVEHILSEPSSNWTGRSGRINASMLPQSNGSLRVLICGPDGFTQSAVKLLHDAGYKSENTHIFQG
ncbi:cytochrome b5-like Heme/Steroid binding domain protein [Ancylostoma caninum]|uniref:Cytochrome b5-like Heme/Steroid binding domain protein n=1 Tax=Ancylostoma caninum TaxID=29170 RepID=A0A368H6I6_ANCCA|nr:cytochrome b5-like Heme/Steroid binding domain protein [Ancylostoma caninum]